MTNPLIFDDLQEILHRHIDPLPDYEVIEEFASSAWIPFG